MCELLEFMYQGVVNVKHTELQSFMKIGQLLQIKGLATNSNASPGSSGSEKSTNQMTNAAGDEPNNSSNSSHNNSSSNNNNNNNNSNSNSSKVDADHNDSKNSAQSNSRPSTTSPNGCRSSVNDPSHLFAQSKRSAPAEFNSDSLSIYSRKQLRRSLTEHSGAGCSESGDNADTASMENALNSEEFFLPPIPHISMVESRYDLGSLKREGENHHAAGGAAGTGSTSSSTAVGSLRNPFAPAFNLDYNNFYKAGNSSGPSSSNNVPGIGPGVGVGGSNNGSNSLGVNVGPATEYPNELYMPSDYSKNFANHMDIPSSRCHNTTIIL